MGSRFIASRLTALATRIPAGMRVTLCYAGAMIWAKALSMLVLPLLTRMLPPSAFGRLELLSSAAEIGGLIAGAGLVDTLYRFASGPRDGQQEGARITGLALLIAAVSLTLIVLFSGAIAAAMPLPTPRGDIILLGVAVSLEVTIGVPLSWLRMQRNAAAFTALSMTRITLQLSLVAALAACGFGVRGVLWAGAGTSILFAGVMMLRQTRATGITLAPVASLRLLAYGMPLILSGIADFVLGTADRWLLAGRVSPAELGQYALAAKVALIVALLAQPFQLWWYPQRLMLIGTQEGRLRSGRVVGAGAAMILSGGALTALVAPWLVAWLAPPSYAAASVMAPFLVAAAVLQVLGNMANAACYTRRTGALPMAVNGIAATTALLLYLLLIPPFGVTGAIAATVAGQSVRLAIFAAISQRIVKLEWPVRRLAAMAGVGAIAGAAPLVWGTGGHAVLIGLAAVALTVVLAIPAIRRVIDLPYDRVRAPHADGVLTTQA